WGGVGWLAALAGVLLLGGRRLLATARELDSFDGDDLRWLRGRGAPQGRFNAGQKINAVLTAAFTILFGVSGLLLWFGEEDTRYRFASTVILHDGVMYVSLALLVGHLYLALIHPATRHALRGMTLGSVSSDWASRHHAKWRPDCVDEPDRSRRRRRAECVDYTAAASGRPVRADRAGRRRPLPRARRIAHADGVERGCRQGAHR